MIDHLADADGHIIEPGDLWAERLPNDLRPLAPRFYRDPEGAFHSRIYGIAMATLPIMHRRLRPKAIPANLPRTAAFGMPLARVLPRAHPHPPPPLPSPRCAIDGP